MKIEEVIKQVKTEGTLEEIRNAEPIGYHAKIDGTWYNVPLDDTNRHYIQMMIYIYMLFLILLEV